jgi:hypothetical protein
VLNYVIIQLAFHIYTKCICEITMLSVGAYLSVYVFQRLNQLTNVREIWYGRYANVVYRQRLTFHFQSSVITKVRALTYEARRTMTHC